MRFLGLTGIVLLVAALLVWLTSSPDFSNTSDTLGNAATGNPVAFDRASEKSVPTTRQGSDSQRSQIDSAQPQGLADPSSAVTSDNSLPDERNGYLKLIAATEKLYWPEEIKTLLESGAVSLDASPEVFAFLRQLVADNREALALVREALALGVGRIPPVESFNQKLPEIWPLGLLNKILGFEAQIAAHEGNLESALRITGDQGALGKLCMESGGCLVHTLVGNAMTSQGQALRQQLLDAGVIATEDYERFLPLLTGSPLDPRNAYAESLLMESTILSKDLRKLAQKNMEPQRNDNLDLVDTLQAAAGISLDRSLLASIYDVEATLEQHRFLTTQAAAMIRAPSFQESLEILGNDFGGLDDFKNFDPATADWARLAQEPGNTNLLGRWMIAHISPNLKSLASRTARTRTEQLAGQIRIACSIHRNLNGELPFSLEELHPHFLPSPPIDPWNGQPVRYSRDEARFYFVGENLLDDKGDEKNDVVFSLN